MSYYCSAPSAVQSKVRQLLKQYFVVARFYRHLVLTLCTSLCSLAWLRYLPYLQVNILVLVQLVLVDSLYNFAFFPSVLLYLNILEST